MPLSYHPKKNIRADFFQLFKSYIFKSSAILKREIVHNIYL